MERDGLTEDEALAMVKDCQQRLLLTGDDNVIMEELGLEPDYIMDVLFP